MTPSQNDVRNAAWQSALATAVRDPDALVDALDLPEEFRAPARSAAELFPLLVTRSYLARMRPSDPEDPLLLQVLPLGFEREAVPGFAPDALNEEQAHIAPGLLQKYAGRALLIATGACAIHCRYCFRRSFPYGDEPRQFAGWEDAFRRLEQDASIQEVILSGGDPLMLADTRLAQMVRRLDEIPHLSRLRIHTRLPIVLPERVTDGLIDLLRAIRMTPIVVVHANHASELVADGADAVRRLVRSGVTVLNQAVLLRRINDSIDAMAGLSERLVNLGAIPYYLHQLDRVAGAAHFEVPIGRGIEIINELRRRLPGYAVPQYVREVPGQPHKVPLM